MGSYRTAAWAAWLLAIGNATGCTEANTDTCGDPTDELSAVAVVVDRGDVIRAEIDFADGNRATGAIPLTVCEDEQLRINGQEPRRTDKSERIVYSANLDTTERSVTFSLRREEGDMSLSIDLPDPFEILTPVEGDMLSRMADTMITWDPAGPADGTMRIELGEEIGGGICIHTAPGEHHYKDRGGVDVPDAGMWTIPGGTVIADEGGDCGAHYSLSRIVQGEYPDALAPGGYIEARVERIVTFSSVP